MPIKIWRPGMPGYEEAFRKAFGGGFSVTGSIAARIIEAERREREAKAPEDAQPIVEEKKSARKRKT